MRKKYNAKFRAKVALEAVKVERTMAELSNEFGAHENQIGRWRKQLLELNGRFKIESHLIFSELDEFKELEKIVDDRIHYYNFVRKYLALGNKSPIKYLKEKGKLEL